MSGVVNFDRTFCVSDKCKFEETCASHASRIKEWARSEKRVVPRPISMGDFYEQGKDCEMYSEKEMREVEL